MTTQQQPVPPTIVSWRTRITDTSGTPLPAMVAVDTRDGELILQLGTHEFDFPKASAQELVALIVNALDWTAAPAAPAAPAKTTARRRTRPAAEEEQ